MKLQSLSLAIVVTVALSAKTDEPKRLLLVTTTGSFRHPSIALAEQTIRELAKQSGDFIVVSTTDSPDYPSYPAPTTGELAGGSSGGPGGRGGPGGQGGPGGRGGGIPGLSETQQTAVRAMNDGLAPLSQALTDARTALSAAISAGKGDPTDLKSKVDAVAAAELALASARTSAFAKLQASEQKLNEEQITALVRQSSTSGRGGPGGGPGGPGGRGPRGLSEPQQTAVRAMDESLAAVGESLTTARRALVTAAFSVKADPADLKSKVDAVAAAELAVAVPRANAIAKLQASEQKLNDEQLAAVVRQTPGGGGRGGGPGGGRGGPPGFGGNSEQNEKVRKVLAAYMSPEALESYDGVFFLHTTGQLPFPDMAAFLSWVKSGKGVMGSHAASDCFHETDTPGQPHSFIQMLGGEFAGHGAQETVVMQNGDPTHPATVALGKTFTAKDEMYLFKNYDQSKVQTLLSMTEHPNQKTPGHYAVSWAKSYGSGRVFYTSLGHRLDIWDPAWKGNDGQRTNSPEVAEAFRKHLLGGIRWALGIAKHEAAPQQGVTK